MAYIYRGLGHMIPHPPQFCRPRFTLTLLLRTVLSSLRLLYNCVKDNEVRGKPARVHVFLIDVCVEKCARLPV